MCLFLSWEAQPLLAAGRTSGQIPMDQPGLQLARRRALVFPSWRGADPDTRDPHPGTASLLEASPFQTLCRCCLSKAPPYSTPPKKGCLPLFITLETWALLAVLWRALLDSFIDGGGQTEGCLWRSQPGDAPWRPPMHSTQVRGAEPTPSNRWRLPGFSLDYSVPYAWISRCHNLKIRTRGSP